MSNDRRLEQRREFEQYLIRKAWGDEAFRAELVADPSAVFLRELSALDPEGDVEGEVNIKLLEETPQQAYFVLPLNPAALELSDAQLDEVAGGARDCGTYSCNKCGVKVGCLRINIPKPFPGAVDDANIVNV